MTDHTLAPEARVHLELAQSAHWQEAKKQRVRIHGNVEQLSLGALGP